MSLVRVEYTDVALPLSTTVYTLYDTTDTKVASGTAKSIRNLLVMHGMYWFSYSIWHDENGTIKASFSNDGGTNWFQHGGDISASAPAAGTTTDGEIFLEGYKDWRVEWTNGGSNQTVFEPNLSLNSDRSPSG